MSSEKSTFLCGPYLLAPTSSSMTIAWEAATSEKSYLYFGVEENALSLYAEIQPNPSAPLFGGKQMYLYSCCLTELRPDTTYFYRVEHASHYTVSAFFHTLPERPEQLHCLTISDSHGFATRSAFHRSCWEQHPDLILHCGDLVEGTGAQAEQFALFLGAKYPQDFIHYYPVIYAEGNHDHGGPYFDAYIYQLQQKAYGGTVRGDSSIDLGGLHLITMNSGPWGLFQMNSESTGTPVEESTLAEIQAATQWLRCDLESKQAKSAQFRLLMMHHPYSDAYTARYIPEIAEMGHVDLFLAGHTHSYARYVSSHPEHGASTVYITQQDGRMYNVRGNYGILHFDFIHGIVSFESQGEPEGADQSKCFERTVIAQAKQELEWSNVTFTPSEIHCGDLVSVEATVRNIGEGIAAAVLPVSIDGTYSYLYEFSGAHVLLETGQEKTLCGEVRVTHTGDVKLQLSETEETIHSAFRDVTAHCNELVVRVGDGTAAGLQDDTIAVNASVQNIGSIAGVLQIPLEINGEVVATTALSLESGEEKSVSFTHHFLYGGTYQISVAGSVPTEVVIEEGIQGMPMVIDRSGNENHAYIHGRPLLGTDELGNGTLILDGYHDYLEVPDSESLHIKDAVSGVIWVKFPVDPEGRPGLTRFTEPYNDGKGFVNDHNPLFMKGVCLGWGTSYQFRMVVRESGKVGYGICFEDDNGEFSWNDRSTPETGIRQGEWMQIASCFNRQDGGDSYENNIHTAHVNPPPFDAPAKNWAGEPLRIGLGFKNKVHRKRVRGTYHTMLPGTISQACWYDRKLSSGELVSMKDVGSSIPSDSLKLQLRFEPQDFVTIGSHTTQWVPFSGKGTLKLNAIVPDQTELKLHIEYKTESSVLPVVSAPVFSSTEQIILSEPTAKYARITSEFHSVLGSDVTSVPELHCMELIDQEEHIVWSTQSAWNKGSFTGAVGHQNSDVYRNHADDLP